MKAGWEHLLDGGAVPQSWEEKPAWVLLPALLLPAFEPDCLSGASRRGVVHV